MANNMSLGSWVIVTIAVITSAIALIKPVPKKNGLEMWLFSPPHLESYEPVVGKWNSIHEPDVNLFVISIVALGRRMLSGFLSETPTADLLEVDVNISSRAFTGPIDDVGFVDLTDRLHKEGVLEQLNSPSFSPWTSRGRIFGLPHDVHPVLLCYRADIVEAAGIDMATVETWEDFARELRPLIQDTNGDGRVDRYLLNFWIQHLDPIEALMLQAGGRYFDEGERLVLNSEVNAIVLSTMVTWIAGPGRIAIDAEEFQPYGNNIKRAGRVIASIMPDWLGGVWKKDIPHLSGKLKLMPLPAWERGGRRTSVWGGSMLGIAKTSENIDQAWAFAKEIYLSEYAAQRLYETNGIISPAKSLWSASFYDVADPFFSGQTPGRMYIEQAPNVPLRSSSAFNHLAKLRVRDALAGLRDYAVQHKVFQVEELLPEARRQLQLAEIDLQRRIDRNLFLADEVQ